MVFCLSSWSFHYEFPVSCFHFFSCTNILFCFVQRLCGGIEQAYQNWDYPVKDVQLMHKLMDTPYFEKCILLCWYMVIQDPMMYLEEDLEKDSIFDRTTYKEFVQKGDRVKFVVWPALYLYKGGPLLYKGVVQAYSQ